MASRSAPPNVALPSLTSHPARPASTYASVDLPEPLGPIIACTSPAGTCSDTPLRIGLSATVAWRLVMSSMVNRSKHFDLQPHEPFVRQRPIGRGFRTDFQIRSR